MAAMERLVVRKNNLTGNINISFRFIPENGKEKVFNFGCHEKNPASSFLEQISTRVSKYVNTKKKAKQKGQKEAEESVASGNKDPEVIIALGATDGHLLCKDLFQDGSVVQIGNTSFQVSVDPPFVISLKLPGVLLTGYPIYPRVELEHSTLDKCTFTWFKEKYPKGSRHEELRGITPEGKWEFVKQDTGPSIYIPLHCDLGHRFKLVCEPVNGEVKEVISASPVTRGPDVCPFESRHQHTQKTTEFGRFRVVCYNLLADVYSSSEMARDVLYAYCPEEYLNSEYRKQLILRELQGYKADIYCLQEVDQKFFSDGLHSILSAAGYQGYYKSKRGYSSEGSSIFYRESKFSFEGSHDLDIINTLQHSPENQDLWESVCKNRYFKEKFAKRRSVMQVLELKSKEVGEVLVVASVHLYYHPKAPHVRLIQLMVCLRHLQTIVRRVTSMGSSPAVMLCGDFNSVPESGVHQLLREKHIPANHSDWFAGGKTEYAGGLILSHDLDLHSACGYPRYTNYVAGFSGSLDYIYIDSNKLQVDRIIPFPEHEDVIKYTALPNQVFPSDHLAVVCDLMWNEIQLKNE